MNDTRNAILAIGARSRVPQLQRKAFLRAALASAALVASSAITQPAAAQVAAAPPVPSQCTAKAKHTEKYGNGYSRGAQRADKIFAAADVNKDPNKLKKKLGKVLDKLHEHVREVIAGDVKDGRRCRVQGVADGFVLRLAQLLGQCVLDGAQWAQFSANLYCELSIENDGLEAQGQFYRAPAGLCGTSFENVCDSAYGFVATEGARTIPSHVDQFLRQRSVVLTTYPGCRPYTESSFELAFEQAMLLDCAYEVP